MINIFLEQPRRGKTREMQLTPNKRSAVWGWTLIAIMMCLSVVVYGQQAQPTHWTLDACVQYALDHNLTVKQSELVKSQREVELNTAKNSVWPGVQASASQNFSFGRGLSQDNTYVSSNTANTSFGIGGSMNLFTGLRVKNNIEMGKLNLEAATADCDKAKEDICIAVTQAYMLILYQIELCDVAQLQIAIDSAQVERLTALYELGKIGPAEVAARKSTLAQSRLTYTQAHNGLVSALLDMTQLLELESPEGFTVATPDDNASLPTILPSPEQIYQKALGNRAAVKAEEIRTDCAKTNVALAKSGWYPTLSMNGGLVTDYYALLGHTGKGFGAQLRDNFSPYLGFTLNVPIFDRLETRNNVRLAQLQLGNQQIQIENIKKQLYKEIQQAYYNAVSAKEKLASSEVAEVSAKEAFELETALYENGKSTSTAFNEAKNNYLQAASNLAQARCEFLYQVRLLELLAGEN
ncbi:MAG: TolC family protein [Bacteroidales bacterium]|nr:TolC family protein [Bacteroidales bacterium]